MSRAAQVRTAGLGMLLALSACAAPPGRDTGPSGTLTPAPSSGTLTPASPSGPSSSASLSGTLSPQPPTRTPLPALRAAPARCPQPGPGVDDLRAEPVESPWRVVAADKGHGTLEQLAVSGDGAVWATRTAQRETAAGMETTSGGLRRWDGGRWRTYPLPSGTEVVAVAAVSAEQAWVFGAADGMPGLVGTVANGTMTTQRLAMPGDASVGRYATAARGPWVAAGETAMRWEGAAWREYRLPARAAALGGEGDDVWTVSTRGPAARWNGAAWQAITVPELGPPENAGSPRAHLDDVAVLGPGDVWAVGGMSWLVPGAYDEQGEPLERLRPVALHWDGRTWECEWGPPGTTFAQAEPDGRGGMWVLDPTGSRLLHYMGGRWTSVAAPGRITALAHRPGTGEVYAAGHTGPEDGLTRPTLWVAD